MKQIKLDRSGSLSAGYITKIVLALSVALFLSFYSFNIALALTDSGHCGGMEGCSALQEAACDQTSGCFWVPAVGGGVGSEDGICGTANRTYPAEATSYGSDFFCQNGNPIPSTSPFPPPGGSVSWYCKGFFSSINSGTCTATHLAPLSPSLEPSCSAPNPGPSASGYEWVQQGYANCQKAGAYGSPICIWNGDICNAGNIGQNGSFEEYSGPPSDIMYCVTYYSCSRASSSDAFCSINSFVQNSPGSLSATASWSAGNNSSGFFYDMFIYWDGGSRSLVGKDDGTGNTQSGNVSHTFSNYGQHSVTIESSSCRETSYININNIPPPSCSINSFTADDTTPPYNTGTTLRFSLNSPSPSWSINLLQGGTWPSPSSGTGSSGTSWTNNLTSTHVYRLSCGNDTRDLVVTVSPPVCVPNGSCSAPTPACGQTTTGVNNCGGFCSKTGGACSCVPNGSCSAPTPACGQTTTGVDNCGGFCSKTGGACSCGSCSAPTPACGQTTTGVDSCNNICSRTGPPCVVAGSCGSRNTTYPAGTTSYPAGSTYCSRGNPTSSPAFPPPGGSVSWYCVDAGGSSGQCTANVEIQTHTVTTTHSSGGQVHSADSRINCGGTCSSDYDEGSTVTLRAIPSSTYWQFSSWTGDCSGFTTSVCTLNVNGPKNATALFIPRKFKYIEF